MKHFGFAAFLLAVGACSSSSPPNPPLGQGTVAVNGTSAAVTAAWAELGYSFFDSANDSYGTYIIRFTADSQAATLTCNERLNLQTIAAFSLLEIDTPQVYHHATGPAPVLALGDIPVVAETQVPASSAPTSPIAAFQSSATETGGTVTITAFGGDSIDGTYTATGSETLAGSFSVPVCPALH